MAKIAGINFHDAVQKYQMSAPAASHNPATVKRNVGDDGRRPTWGMAASPPPPLPAPDRDDLAVEPDSGTAFLGVIRPPFFGFPAMGATVQYGHV